MCRLFVALPAIAFWIGLTSAVSAAEVSIADFFGRYTGSGLSKTEDANFLGFEMRDLDVTIAPAGDGFSVAWTTLRRKGPDQPKEYVKRASREMTFLPTGQPDIFRPVAQGDPLAAGEVSWARIEGRTLFVYVMTVSERGIYEIQTYARTLGARNLKLVFTRVRDGERVRKVTGKLRRIGE